MDDLYRENILEHYKRPHNWGELAGATVEFEDNNPLCGDEITITLLYDEQGDTISDVRFEGRGCAISQAATSMLVEKIAGRKATEVAAMPKEEVLDELGIPLGPVRLKCALLGLSTLKVAIHKSKGTPLPDEWGADPDLDLK